VRKLCVLEPSKRLGYGVNGFQELRAHKFFAGINWSELEVENLADRPPGVVLRKKHGIPASTIARMQVGAPPEETERDCHGSRLAWLARPIVSAM
jgi:hypothetical protein